jgi:CRISPR-associated endonuclease/helicase Cas3
VVEQSVDIDLDFIVSDLAPTDMLLQRMGRLWRHERSSRKAEEPEFWIRTPTIPEDATAKELKQILGRSARVYAPYVLLRTSSVFSNRPSIQLPGDIRALLEATYADPSSSEPAAWRELYEELQKEKAVLRAHADAATRVLGNPALKDEEGVLTRRRGPPTVSLVLLRDIGTRSNGEYRLTALDGATVDVSEFEWRRNAAQFLNRWMVRTPKYMVPNVPRPRWLGLHIHGDTAYALVGDDGKCVFPGAEGQGYTVTYRNDLGIFSERSAAASPQWNHDDEFDG